MSSPATITAAVRAIELVLEQLADAGIEATRDAGAFYPQPAGVLVGLPSLVGRGLYARTFELPVLVVSGDPIVGASGDLVVDRLYALAEEAALALGEDSYRVTSYRSSANAEPLPAIELLVTVTVTETEV